MPAEHTIHSSQSVISGGTAGSLRLPSGMMSSFGRGIQLPGSGTPHGMGEHLHADEHSLLATGRPPVEREQVIQLPSTRI